MTKARKRTGAHKREQRQRLGAPRPPDESKVRTPQAATVFWVESGRAGLAMGQTLRVDADVDLAAFPSIYKACKEHQKPIGERTLTSVLVAGVEPVVKQLEEIVLMSGAAEELEAPQNVAELVLAEGAKYGMTRRKAIGRLHKGARNRALRHAFGLSRPLIVTSVDSVRDVVLGLLAGRAEYPGSAGARVITAADVKRGKQLVGRLNDLKSQQGAQKSTTAEAARNRDVLHAALELFYDRFGAAVDLAFENDDELRVSLLSMIPRRKERRAAAKAPVSVTPAQAANE
jgi:hypothetical protein